jgi:hypothetical protein
MGVLIWQAGCSRATELILVAANPAAARIAGVAYGGWLGRALAEQIAQAQATERQQVYFEVVSSGKERALPLGIYPELGSSAVRGTLLPLPARCVAVIFEPARAPTPVEDEMRKLTISRRWSSSRTPSSCGTRCSIARVKR